MTPFSGNLNFELDIWQTFCNDAVRSDFGGQLNTNWIKRRRRVFSVAPMSCDPGPPD